MFRLHPAALLVRIVAVKRPALRCAAILEGNQMSNTNIDTVKAMYAAFGRGDIGAVIDATAGGIDWESYGNPAHFPTLGPHRGRAEVQNFFAKVGGTLEFSEFQPQEFFSDGNTVIALGHFTAKVKTTGKTASSHWAHVFTFKDGKVEKFREYADTASFADAYRG